MTTHVGSLVEADPEYNVTSAWVLRAPAYFWVLILLAVLATFLAAVVVIARFRVPSEPWASSNCYITQLGPARHVVLDCGLKRDGELAMPSGACVAGFGPGAVALFVDASYRQIAVQPTEQGQLRLIGPDWSACGNTWWTPCPRRRDFGKALARVQSQNCGLPGAITVVDVELRERRQRLRVQQAVAK